MKRMKWTLMGLTIAMTFSAAALQAAETCQYPEEKLGWKLAAQCWTFRKYTLFETLDMLKKLDIKYVEMFPGQKISKDSKANTHYSMSKENRDRIKAKLKETGITLINYGVVGLPGDETKCRRIFDFAKDMGISTILSEPNPKDLKKIGELAKKYNIVVALHNHPKPTRYWDPNFVKQNLRGKKNMAAACDVGHWVRSGVDPIKGLMMFQPHGIRVIHFKDLNVRGQRNAHDVPWGTGASDAAGMIRELHNKGVRNIVFTMEYENWSWKLEDLAKCVKFFRDTCRKELAGVPRVVTPGKNPGDAPSDAIVLFDGKDLSKWVKTNGKPAGWEVKDGAMIVKRRAGSIKTKQDFGDCQLHIEWASPSPAKGSSQGRGNSGVFFMERYEVQVLDNFKSYTYPQGQAGSIYKESRPLVNACRKPGQWQSYDIIFRTPKFDKSGKCIKPAVLTVFHNGVLIQDHHKLEGTTGYFGLHSYRAHGDKLPIMLQDHGNPVKYRNIWIRPLASSSK